MKLTQGTQVYCPICKKEIEVEAGFFLSLAASILIARLHKEGGYLTCRCGTKIAVKGE